MATGMQGESSLKSKAESPRQAPLFINCQPVFCSQDGVLDMSSFSTLKETNPEYGLLASGTTHTVNFVVFIMAA